MNVVKLKEGIYEVGAVDWNVRNFHGYSTNRGSSYNAYLIIDEKITLIDTVKNAFSKEIISRIKEIIDPAKIDYIISNHVEPDHSGSLAEVAAAAPNAKIVTSNPSGLKGLEAHYGKNLNFMPVKSGDTLSIGKRSLNFVLTPMLHWPDSMVTYCPEEKILFSNDAFGQHLASSSKFDDENNYDILMYEAKKYYANILMPYGAQAKKALSIVKGLDIDIIATGHGIIFRKYINDIFDKYEYFSDSTNENKAVIVYDSMWASTEKIAKAILEGFKNKGVSTQLFDLKSNHISDIITEVLKAEYIAVGSPTLNNNMMPNVSAFLTYLKGLAPAGKKAFAFGSYGWGGQSVEQVNDVLKSCKFDIILEPIKVLYVPTEEKLREIEKSVETI
ncbi:MAG: FprA family A-type flavoprotein [Firmicutes bacterium]|nr:FprA family A-type flavoprotein [Bacillota bacterium]